jgi:hypothetical protein
VLPIRSRVQTSFKNIWVPELVIPEPNVVSQG